MEKHELRNIILKQRKYYGEALEQLHLMLKHAGHNDYAEIALRFKENYGLDDGLVTNHKDVFLSRDELREEMTKLFRRKSSVWLGAADVRNDISYQFTDTDWTAILREFFREGLIDRKGSHNNTVYRWIDDDA